MLEYGCGNGRITLALARAGKHVVGVDLSEPMLGDFEEAQKEQKTALQRAKKLGWDTRDQEARLADYAASKAWEGNLFTL